MAVHLQVRELALLAGLLCGLTNILVDADHIPYYFLDIRAVVHFNAFHFGTGRFLHPALFFIALCCFACAGGLLVLNILKNWQTQGE